MSRTFEIVPASTVGRWVIGGFGLLSLAIAGAVAWTLASTWEDARAAWLPLTVLPLSGSLLVYVAWSMRNVRLVLSPDSLRIQGDLFGRTVPRSILEMDRARLVNLNTEKESQPMLRTFGSGAPGYLAGWFRLRDRRKALVFVTDTAHVVSVPTTAGYVLLLSVARPEEFLRALKG